MSRYGVLVLPYRPDFYLWELIGLFRRMVVIITINVMGSELYVPCFHVGFILICFLIFSYRFLQLFFGIAIIYVMLVVQVWCAPYRGANQNRLSFVWGSTVLLTLLAAVVFETKSRNGLDDNTSGQLAWIVVGVFLFSLIFSVYVLYHEVQERRHTPESTGGIIGFTIEDSDMQDIGPNALMTHGPRPGVLRTSSEYEASLGVMIPRPNSVTPAQYSPPQPLPDIARKSSYDQADPFCVKPAREEIRDYSPSHTRCAPSVPDNDEYWT